MANGNTDEAMRQRQRLQAQQAEARLAPLKAKNDEDLRELWRRLETRTQRIKVNKRTQRIRREGETADEVTLVIEPRDEGTAK